MYVCIYVFIYLEDCIFKLLRILVCCFTGTGSKLNYHDSQERDTSACNRVVTKEIRESMLWVAVIQTFNKREFFFKEIDDLNSSLNSVNSSEKSFTSTLPLSISTRGDHEEEEEDEFEIKRENLRNGVSSAAYHFSRIFSTPPLSQPLFQPLPVSVSTVSLPLSRQFLSTPSPSILPSFPPLPSLRFTVVLGGSVRTDKFRALDYLINTVRMYMLSSKF